MEATNFSDSEMEKWISDYRKAQHDVVLTKIYPLQVDLRLFMDRLAREPDEWLSPEWGEIVEILRSMMNRNRSGTQRMH